MTRENLFSRLKSRRLYDTVFKRQTRNVCATETPGRRFAVRFGTQIHSHALCSQCVSARRRSAGRQQRSYTSPAPWQPRLPTEVWCAIWAWLPFSARITVTHTCRHWRLAALACPRLWTHLRFYSTITRRPRSRGHTRSGYDPVEQTANTGVTNFSCAPEILARSKRLRLYTTLDVPAPEPVLDQIQDLGLLLSRASRRIASITVRAASPTAAGALMWGMRSLPALRRLSLQTWRPAKAVFDGPVHPHMHFELSAANLEDVDLGAGFYWPRGTPQFPKVRRIALTVDNNIHHDLATVLDACAGLRVLTVDLGSLSFPDWPVGDSVSASLRGRCAILRAVCLRNLSANNAEIPLSTFHAPAIRGISIGASIDSAGRCGAIFRDLRGAVQLVVRRHSGHIPVSASDLDGRARRVTGPLTESKRSWTSRDAVLHSILRKCIDWRNVVTLSVSASHWFHCVYTLPIAPAVRCLRLLMDNESHGCVLGQAPDSYDPFLTAGKFPALRKLDIVGTGKAVRMTADDVAAVIYTLGIGLPLRKIGVDHTVLMGSRPALRPLAQKVAIRIFRV